MNEAPQAQNQGMPDLSSAISKIMEHPELISMVASVLGNDSAAESPSAEENAASTADAPSQPTSAPPSPPPEILSTLAPMLSRISALGSGGTSDKNGFRHEALLCALKPYLNSSRVGAIDYIIKISKMSSLIQGLK